MESLGIALLSQATYGCEIGKVVVPLRTWINVLLAAAGARRGETSLGDVKISSLCQFVFIA